MMGKLIDADALQKYLREEYHGMISDESMKIYKILQLIEEQPTVGGWIPCSERLPETHGRYLTTCIGKDIPQIRLFEGTWDSLAEVLAWMPLPKPYQKEGE